MGDETKEAMRKLAASLRRSARHCRPNAYHGVVESATVEATREIYITIADAIDESFSVQSGDY